METRSNILFVGTVVGALLLALAVFLIWLARPARDETLHQIYFDTSVAGLRAGSPVTLSGVPVGSVRSVSLVPEVPGRVRVMVSLQEAAANAPGLKASIESSFVTGDAHVTLDSSDQPERRGVYADRSGTPTIPAATGGGLLSGNAQQTIGKVAEGIRTLNDGLTPARRAEISAELAAFERRSAQLAADASRIGDEVGSARRQIGRYGREAERWGQNADALERKLRDGSAAGPLRSARASLARAREALTDVDAGAGDARDRVRAATRQIDKVTQAVRDVRADVDPVRRGVEQVEREGLGGKPELPDYEPDRSK